MQRVDEVTKVAKNRRRAWYISDELGWCRPTEWGQMYGMNPGDYGYGG